jgi:NAD+ kinase
MGFVKENGEEIFNFNVWSSGIWISTATGSTAVMAAAGGVPMDLSSSKLQYMVRLRSKLVMWHLETENDSIESRGSDV